MHTPDCRDNSAFDSPLAANSDLNALLKSAGSMSICLHSPKCRRQVSRCSDWSRAVRGASVSTK